MSKIKNIQSKEKIFNFINKHGVMTLATESKKGPWVCTVYYGIDDAMNLYIVSNPKTNHCVDIDKEKRIAFNIFDSHQKIYKPKIGVQGRGSIKMVQGVINITKALKYWHKQNPGIEKAITLKTVKKATGSKLWKITPSYMKLFDEKQKPGKEYIVWKK